MMTKDEIEKGCKLCASASDCSNCNDCPAYTNCVSVAAYNLITEQENEIAQLKADNARLTAKLGQVLLSIDTVKEMNVMCNIEAQVKQAKIDVLNELRTYCVERENYKGIQQQQNEDLLRRNDERKFRPELTLDEIFAIRTGADKANGQSTMANKVVEKIDRMIEELKK